MADMVIQPWAALVIGTLAALVSVVGYRFLSVSGIRNLASSPDPLSARALLMRVMTFEPPGNMSSIDISTLIYVARGFKDHHSQ